MADSPNVETRKVTKRYKLVLLKKVHKGFARPGDKDDTVCIVRALEKATRDIILTDDDIEEVAREIRKNEIRLGKAAKKGKRNGQSRKWSY